MCGCGCGVHACPNGRLQHVVPVHPSPSLLSRPHGGRGQRSELRLPCTTISFRPHGFWAGVCRLAWWAGGIPSRGLHAPLVLPVGAASTARGSIAGPRRCIRWGDDAGNVGHRRYGSFPVSGPDRQIARNPRRPVVPLWGGDIPRAPGCSLEVTIRWLWGVKQPSRLTWSATNQIGASTPAGADPSVGSPSGTELCSRCVEVGSP